MTVMKTITEMQLMTMMTVMSATIRRFDDIYDSLTMMTETVTEVGVSYALFYLPH